MKFIDQGSRILDLLKGKFIAIFRLIYKIRSLEDFAIYININNGKFLALLSEEKEEVEEEDLYAMIEDNPYSFQKTKGDFKIIINYKGDTSTVTNEDLKTIREISLELLNLISYEAIEVQKRVSEESKVDELRKKSQFDGLTGLYNRHTFDELYVEIYNAAKEENKDFSILMLDIDNFKQVNDRYGHQFGDRVLQKVAEEIKLNVRKDDVVARYGGEEIIIILVNIDQGGAKVIAERIRTSVSSLNTEGVGVTISIGISNYKKGAFSDKEGLIYIADKCLYRAKELGKNNVIGVESKNFTLNHN